MSFGTSGMRVLACGAALWLGFAARASADPKAFVEPTTVDLGIVEEGKLFERYVEIKNVGDGVLLLEDLKTSCGCTAAAVDGEVELTSGKSQKVRLTFNTRNMDGPVEKRVTLTTNDPSQRHFEVKIKANVYRSIRLEPKFLELREVASKGPWEQLVRLESDVPLKLELVSAFVLGGQLRQEPSKTFDVTMSEPRVEGDRRIHEVTVRLRTPAKALMVTDLLVMLKNQEGPNDSLRVTMRGEILGRLRPSSSFVVLKAVDPGETTRQDVTISAAEGTFKVLRAEVPKSDVAVTLFPSQDGKQTVVSVSYVGTEPGANGVRNLIVETDDPVQKKLEIPVRFQTKAPRASTPTPATGAQAAAKPGTDSKKSAETTGK